MNAALRSFVKGVAPALILSGLATGCALHYYDKATSTEHLWGFGHLKMRAVPRTESKTNAVMAYVTGINTLGLNLGVGQDFSGMAMGWNNESRIIIKQDDSAFYLLWPTNTTYLPLGFKSFFTVRVGTNFPSQLQLERPLNQL